MCTCIRLCVCICGCAAGVVCMCGGACTGVCMPCVGVYVFVRVCLVDCISERL